MNIKISTKISQARWLLLALCSIALAISAEVAGAQAGRLSEQSTLKRRNIHPGDKDSTTVTRKKKGTHNTPANDLNDQKEEAFDWNSCLSMLLKKYKVEEKDRQQIIKEQALQKRKYASYTAEQNETFLASELFKYHHNCALSCYDDGKHEEARLAYLIASLILLDNTAAFGSKYDVPWENLSQLLDINSISELLGMTSKHVVDKSQKKNQ